MAPPGAREALLAVCGPGRVLDVDADGFATDGHDAAFSVANAAAHPRPRTVATRLAASVRSGGVIALAAPPGSPWARFETAYRHFHAFSGFDVLDHDGFALVVARRP